MRRARALIVTALLREIKKKIKGDSDKTANHVGYALWCPSPPTTIGRTHTKPHAGRLRNVSTKTNNEGCTLSGPEPRRNRREGPRTGPAGERGKAGRQAGRHPPRPNRGRRTLGSLAARYIQAADRSSRAESGTCNCQATGLRSKAQCSHGIPQIMGDKASGIDGGRGGRGGGGGCIPASLPPSDDRPKHGNKRGKRASLTSGTESSEGARHTYLAVL